MGDSTSNNIRRCGQIGEGDEDLLTMEDAMNEHDRLVEDASAVLGGSDPENCSYSKGYINRQALYACSTCTPNGNAGICLACSYACHEGHDLYELYTKRFFRCDCGNDKFPENGCKLDRNKVGMNSRNRYNQNFTGCYCTCRRPYPDLDDNVGDEMIQCIMCEDWYHGRHLKTTAPDEFVEMICHECMSKYPFMWAYNQALSYEATELKKDSDSSEAIDVISCDENQNTDEGNAGKLSDQPNTLPSSESVSDVSESTSATIEAGLSAHGASTSAKNSISESTSLKRSGTSSTEESESSPKKIKHDNDRHISPTENEKETEVCQLKSLLQKNSGFREHATFWPVGWRTKLCKCTECMNMYQDRNIEYLTDESDTVEAYENKADKSGTDAEEQPNIVDMFSGLDRVQQIEVARGFEDFRSELSVFLESFAREGKIVKVTDIREFFQRMEQKRQRSRNVPQHNCR